MNTNWRNRWMVFVIALLALSAIALQSAGAPSVVARIPARGEEHGILEPLQLTFSEPMNQSSFITSFSVLPTTEFSIVWSDERTVEIIPVEALQRDTVYRVMIAASAESAAGEPFAEAFSFEFRTVGFLQVTQIIPEDGATEIAVDTPIFLMFNRPVVPLAALSDPSNSNLPDPLSISPRIEGSGEWVNTSIYAFTPSEPMRGGTTYVLTVPAGLSDTTGGLLAHDLVWSFSTERPEVVWSDPGFNEQLVPVDTQIRITFNMPISLESAQERFALRTTSLLGDWLAKDVPGTLSVEGEVLVFEPASPLDFDRTYAVFLDAGIAGVHGGLGTAAASDWRFSTVPLPKILSTDPEHGDRNAYPYTSFVIYFNAPIDPDSVLENITISPEPDPEEISGYFRSWNNAYVLRFGAEPSHEYTISVGPDIQDPYGNVTGQELRVTFQTRALDPTAWLHVPGSTGTFSTYEAPRIFVAHRNTHEITLTLSKLDLDEYFEALDDWYRYSPPEGSRLRRWTMSVDSPLNEVGYTPADLLPSEQSLEPGIYIIDLQAEGVQWNRWSHRHLLIASPTNLTIKSSDRETLVWATDLQSGEPQPGLILRAYDSDGEAVEATVTDRDGLAVFAGTDRFDWRGITVVGNTPFVLSSSQWDAGISIWDFGFSSSGRTEFRMHLDTDRPIYRPGQTVYFRGIVREEVDVAYNVPADTSVSISIRDAAWNLLLEETIALDAFGTFTSQVALADEATIGTYRIEISSDGAYFSETFEVAAYRAPEFEVSVVLPESEWASDQSVNVTAYVDYFFGAPVVDREVQWQVFAESYAFTPPGLGRFTFTDRDDPWICWSCWWLPAATPVPVLEGTGRTDENGQLQIAIPADLASLLAATDEDASGSLQITIEATVQGADGQVVSGRSTGIVHPAAFYVGLDTAQSVARATESVPVDVVTVDWLGQRVAINELKYEIVRREWDNVFEEDASGGGRWTWTTIDHPVEDGVLATDGTGSGSFAFIPPEGGTYKVSVSGTDESGRTTQSSLFVWATGPNTVSWRRSNDDRIALIADQTEYNVGDTARVLIPSPYAEPHWALITVEREGVLTREVLRMESNSTVYELPITSQHIPNIYVGVVLVQGREAALRSADGSPQVAETKVGYVALTVSRAPQVLQIEIVPSTSTALPGEHVVYDLWVTDAYGYPVQAALSFDLVDQAVLSLRPRVADAILESFYGQRGLGVSTASGLSISINRLVEEQLQDLEEDGAVEDKFAVDDTSVGSAVPMTMAREESADVAEPEAGLAAQLPADVVVREDFQDTAAWRGQIYTDEDGHAQLSLRMPDNLTTWEARAIGVTGETLVGEGTSELLVTKPLLIRPVTPRFLVVGDRVLLSANVTNQTDHDLLSEITLAQTGLLLEAEPMQRILVPAGQEVRVEWWATALDVDAVELAFSVVSGELSDAAIPRLTTGPDGSLKVFKYTALDIVGTAGQLEELGSRTERILLPDDADLARSQLILQLETSLAAAMREGLDYLEHFEYECTEQVVSRFLPNILTYRALQRLGIENPDLTEKLPTLVAEGIEKLVERQHYNGGWGWWIDDRANAYLTAYAVFALLQAEEAGFVIAGDTIERGLDFLEDQLVSSKELATYVSANRQAWIVYVLAEAGRLTTAEKEAGILFDARDKLSHYARAYLALALDRVGAASERIDTLVADLYAEAIVSATGTHWEEADYDWWAMNTDTRSTAIILDALVQLDPEQPMLPNVVRWLMVARKAGIWETTQETAWALIALTDWMEATGELDADYDYWAVLNGIELVAASADGVEDPTRIEIPFTAMDQSIVNDLTISRSEGEGRLYYTAHLLSHVPVESIAALDRGIIVQRQYVPVDCPLDETCKSVETAVVGEEIQVRLTIIAPHDLYYVVIEDPFPAGCEAVDPALATTSITASQPGLFRDNESGRWPWFHWWWWRWYSRSEFRDEKLALFADYLPAGTYTYQYTLRAVTPGQFNVLPTSAHEFYFPEVFGVSDGMLFEIEDEASEISNEQDTCGTSD